jgi:hypothetical protein
MFAQLVFLAAISAAGAGDGYDALLAEAVRARGDGRLEESLDFLRRAHAIQPSPGLRNNIARVLEELGRWSEAVEQYRAVAADPTADPQLREKDDQRIAELAPKLLYAWVNVELSPPDALVFLDGARVEARTRDARTEPGRRMIEASFLEKRELVLFGIDAPAGRRTTVQRVLSTREANEATIELGTSGTAVRSLTIDRYRLRAPLETISTIRLPAGRYTFDAELDETRTVSRSIELAPGARFELGAILTELAPAREEKVSWWPYAVGAGGAVFAAAGGGLLALAENNRSEIRDAARENGVITGITLARASELESSAKTQSTAGVVLMSAGTAALAGALVGWILQ